MTSPTLFFSTEGLGCIITGTNAQDIQICELFVGMMECLKSPIAKLDLEQTCVVNLALVRVHPAYSHEILLVLPSAALLNNFTLLSIVLDPEAARKRDQKTTLAEYLTRETRVTTGLYVTRFVTTLEPTTSSMSSELGSPSSTVTTNTSNSSRKPSISTSSTSEMMKPTQVLYYVVAVDEDHEVRLGPGHQDYCWAKGAELTALEMVKDTRRLVEDALKVVQELNEADDDGHGERGRGRGMERGSRRGRPIVDGSSADESKED